MVGKWRSLKLALNFDQAHRLRDISGVRIYKTNGLIGTDVFCHFGGQLQVKREVDRGKLRKLILIGPRCCQTKFARERTQNMPCYAVIFAIGVSITQ